MEDLDAFVKGLLNGLAALPEEKMRIDLLGRRLGEVCPEDAARCIDEIYRGRANLKIRIARAALVDHDGLKKVLGTHYGLISEAAVRLGLGKVARLFSDLKPVKTGLSGYDKEEETAMEFVSLGRRRSLARSRIKETIDRLLSDPDPVVIANLLDNPRITEKEVLKIASKRPASPAILKLIISHKVWSKRYDVVKAVAMNPYSPPKVSIALLEFLMTQDLLVLSEDRNVHPALRLGAKELLMQRGSGDKP